MQIRREIQYFIFAIFICLLFVPVISDGQKVALVLSGGASKGAAHIGVIRALEENQIPIDCIAGTSVGAIIGGLYSMGYTPDEMLKLFGSEEFQKWALGISNDKYTYFYRKEDPNGSWVSMDFNFKKKITAQLPTNLVSPQELDYRLMLIC
ncbi:MAG: patatin-like phospholipase family protein, partial [Bacteroidota bacterium]|nr:patatin-like phospholipase family protein [Bacteroidota bacterium]